VIAVTIARKSLTMFCINSARGGIYIHCVGQCDNIYNVLGNVEANLLADHASECPSQSVRRNCWSSLQKGI
jgi:hypothetical protein